MIEGFKIQDKRYESEGISYLDSVEEATGRPCIIQTIEGGHASISVMADLRNDFEITKQQIDGVLKSQHFVRYLSGVALVKEYYDGIPLHQVMGTQNMTYQDKLKIALHILRIVENLHAENLVHRALQPEHFLINLNTKEVKLINVCKASPIAGQRIETGHMTELQGSLQYISPELTGRMNRSIDYRTDIYSLGTIFYELFCERAPFVSDDPLQLVYSHIAKQPEVPTEKYNVPEVLSDIILKMMAKNAEDRYQSVHGILHDLQTCATEFEKKGTVKSFELGLHDHSATFTISEKLYGRENETQQLEEAFTKAKDGHIDLVLVTGYSGIGKTRLINEIYKPLARENGHFISGKFNQFSQKTPYAALTQAFASRIRQILAEGPEIFDLWKNRIQNALGENGQIIVDVIPDLALIIGPQPEPLKLGFNESQTRFLNVFQRFVGALATEEEPMVLFIDDLQWADSDSVELIYTLLDNQSIKHILIIGAYRDNEVSSTHPLSLMLKRLRKTLTNIEILKLNALTPDQVNELVSDSLRIDAKKSHDLAELIARKTGGNPFFIEQFLQNLVKQGLIFFENNKQEWSWKFAEINKLSITDNVVDLVVSKLMTQSTSSQAVLKYASAIGNTFDLSTLCIVTELSDAEVSDALWEAMTVNLIQATDQKSPHINDRIWQQMGIQSQSEERNFRFVHDRIQQAAYSLISAEEKTKTHLKNWPTSAPQDGRGRL